MMPFQVDIARRAGHTQSAYLSRSGRCFGSYTCIPLRPLDNSGLCLNSCNILQAHYDISDLEYFKVGAGSTSKSGFGLFFDPYIYWGEQRRLWWQGIEERAKAYQSKDV